MKTYTIINKKLYSIKPSYHGDSFDNVNRLMHGICRFKVCDIISEDESLSSRFDMYGTFIDFSNDGKGILEFPDNETALLWYKLNY